MEMDAHICLGDEVVFDEDLPRKVIQIDAARRCAVVRSTIGGSGGVQNGVVGDSQVQRIALGALEFTSADGVDGATVIKVQACVDQCVAMDVGVSPGVETDIAGIFDSIANGTAAFSEHHSTVRVVVDAGVFNEAVQEMDVFRWARRPVSEITHPDSLVTSVFDLDTVDGAIAGRGDANAHASGKPNPNAPNDRIFDVV